MNTAEKIVSVYLRLNGFFILNQFTHLHESGHTQESDLIAIRCPKSEEIVNQDEINGKLQIDEVFFTNCNLNKEEVIGLIAEIKAPEVELTFKPEKIEYAKNFFGDFQDKVYLCGVSRSYDNPRKTDEKIEIGLGYVAQKVNEMIRRRNEICNKNSSWYLNEGLLSDLIYLENIGYNR